jgi:hypothetical protein
MSNLWKIEIKIPALKIINLQPYYLHFRVRWGSTKCHDRLHRLLDSLLSSQRVFESRLLFLPQLPTNGVHGAVRDHGLLAMHSRIWKVRPEKLCSENEPMFELNKYGYHIFPFQWNHSSEHWATHNTARTLDSGQETAERDDKIEASEARDSEHAANTKSEYSGSCDEVSPSTGR